MDKYKNYTYYGIVLADVWTENKFKKEIKQEFLDDNFVKNNISETTSAKITNLYHNVIDFNVDEKFDNDNSIKTNYNLLCLTWQVK